MEFSSAPAAAASHDADAVGLSRPTDPSVLFTTLALAALCLILVFQLHLDWDLNPSYSYGWLVPFLAAFSIWKRWGERPARQPLRSNSFAFVCIGIGAAMLLPLRIVAKANPDWRLVSWGVAFCLAAIALSLFWCAGGVPWLRHFAFPVLFCLVAVPWPTQFEQLVVQRLMQLVAAVNVDLLGLFGIVAFRHGNVIELANGVLGVESACSGIRSLQSTLMLSLFLGEFYALTVARRVLLLACGAALAFIFNIARTFFLAAMADRNGIPSIEHWHDPAGWAVIFGCLAAMWALSSWLARNVPPTKRPTDRGSSAFPARATIALVCWLCLVEVGSELWFRAREKRAAVAREWMVTWPNGEGFQQISVPKEAQEMLHANEGRAVAWRDDDGQRWNLFFFKWYPGRTAAQFVKIHRPEICLPASGFTSTGAPRSQLLQVNGASLPTRAYRFMDGATPLHVYYCYWDGTVFRNTEEMIEEDWTMRGRFKRVWSGRRDRGAQTLEVAVWGHEDDASADAAVKVQLARFLKDQA